MILTHNEALAYLRDKILPENFEERLHNQLEFDACSNCGDVRCMHFVLEAVLERATATFDDFAMALPLLGHQTMAAAARIASEATRMAAAASAEETPAENGGQDVWQADS